MGSVWVLDISQVQKYNFMIYIYRILEGIAFFVVSFFVVRFLYRHIPMCGCGRHDKCSHL